MSMSKSVDNGSYGSTSLADLAPGVGARIKERLKKDPMAILPINLYCAALDIKDPLSVIKEFEPDKEDVGIMVTSVIGVIPLVGPILQGIFTLFWKRAAESDNVTKDMLKKELDKLKVEMMKAVDGKIAESEIKQWAQICQSFLAGLKKSCKVLTIHINALKHQFYKTKKADEQVQEAVRIDLELIRDKAMSLHEFCEQDEYLQYTYPYYIESLQIYTVVMTLMDSFWYQIGIRPIFVSGQVATDDVDAVPSFRERMHNNIMPALKTIATGINRAQKDKKPFGVDLKSIQSLLKSDKYLYPVPLIENLPVEIKGGNSIPLMDLESYGSHIGMFKIGHPQVNIPDRPNAHIVRIDACNLCPMEFDSNILNHRSFVHYLKKPDLEPITGCYGIHHGLPSWLTVNLSSKRTVQVRVVAEYATGSYFGDKLPITVISGSYGLDLAKKLMKNDPNGPMKFFPDTLVLKEELGTVHQVMVISDTVYKSGIASSQIFEEVDQLTFATQFSNTVEYVRLLYVELIIHSIKPTNTNVDEAQQDDQEEEEAEEDNKKTKKKFKKNKRRMMNKMIKKMMINKMEKNNKNMKNRKRKKYKKILNGFVI